MTKKLQAPIKLSYRAYGEACFQDPDTTITVPAALHLLLMYHLNYGGNSVSGKDPITAENQIIAESQTGWWRTDRHIFSGTDIDIAPLRRGAHFFLSCRTNTGPALAELERLIAPTGVNINGRAYCKIIEAFATRIGQACLAMLLACGVTNQFDLARGIVFFQMLNTVEEKMRYGTHNMTALLELLLEFPHLSLGDLMDAVGV